MIFFKKTKVILDTNFLLIPGKFGVDIFTQIKEVVNERHQICIFEDTKKELQKIIHKNNSKDSFNAKLGFVMAEQKNLKTLRSSKSHVDDAILSYATKNKDKTIVATHDKDLIKQLKKIPVKIINLKQKKYLIIR